MHQANVRWDFSERRACQVFRRERNMKMGAQRAPVFHDLPERYETFWLPQVSQWVTVEAGLRVVGP
jgi:hypothetical protein